MQLSSASFLDIISSMVTNFSKVCAFPTLENATQSKVETDSYSGVCMWAQRKGSVVLDVIIAAALIVFLILPLFSTVIEKYILESKIQLIQDALDITNISAYNAMDASMLGAGDVSMNSEALDQIYRELLAANLNLYEDLSPKTGSVVEGRVGIESLIIRTSGFPYTCPDGVVLTRPGVHSRIVVPIRPSLYRKIILDLLGKEFVDLHIHVDTELPVNN